MSSETVITSSSTITEAQSNSDHTMSASNSGKVEAANDLIEPAAASEPSRRELSVDGICESNISAGSDIMVGKQITPTSDDGEVKLVDDDSHHHQFMDNSIPGEKLLGVISELIDGYLTERTYREVQGCKSLVFDAMEEKRAAARHLTKAMKELMQYKKEENQDSEFLEHLQDMISDAEKTYAKAVASVDQQEEELEEKLEEHEKVIDKFPTNSPRKRLSMNDGDDPVTEAFIKRAKKVLCDSDFQGAKGSSTSSDNETGTV